MPKSAPVVVRVYQPADERSWLMCRLLSFFDTCYYDDVHIQRTQFDLPSIQLVAVIENDVVGLLDVEIDGVAATIDCIAVRPGHQGVGIGSMMLREALRLLPDPSATLDAWTREDQQAIGWYEAQGFVQNEHYLHVYKIGEELPEGFASPEPLSAPVLAFTHARIEHEASLRARFSRVYVCRQMLRVLSPVG